MLGETRGHARAGGRYTDPHGRPKEIFVRSLGPDAGTMASLHAELANMKGCLVAARLARSLTQEEPALVGAWRNPEAGLHEPRPDPPSTG